MIDVENYKRAVAWLRRNLEELEKEPADPTVQLAVLRSFEVTYNLSEAILRQAYVSLGEDNEAAWLSTRELIWRASEEGIPLSSRKHWIEFGLALESMRETCSLTARGSMDDAVHLLARFANELDSFAHGLERRLVSNG